MMTALRATILGFATLLGASIGVAQAAPGGLKACLDECKHAKLSETNRASCRLDCEAEDASNPEVIEARIDRQTRAAARTVKPVGTATTSGTATSGTGTATTSGTATSGTATSGTATSGTATSGTATSGTAKVSGPGCKAACDADRALSTDDRATCKLECDLDPDSPVNRGVGTSSGAAPATGVPPRGGSPLTFQLTGPPPSAAAQAGFLDKCYATCQHGPYKLSATDFETCKLDCQTMASVLDVASGWVPSAWASAPVKSSPPVQPTSVVAATTPPVSPVPARTTTPRSSGSGATVQMCGEDLSACNDRCSAKVKKCESGCGRKHLIETDRETCKLTCETGTEVCQGDCLAANATCVNSRQGLR